MAGRLQVNALNRYEHSLEELTFNSKPLIDTLTRAAEQLEPQGDKVVEMIERRIMKVARRMKLSFLDSYSVKFFIVFITLILFSNFIHCDKNLTIIIIMYSNFFLVCIIR